jgi:hypothetical protein
MARKTKKVQAVASRQARTTIHPSGIIPDGKGGRDREAEERNMAAFSPNNGPGSKYPEVKEG